MVSIRAFFGITTPPSSAQAPNESDSPPPPYESGNSTQPAMPPRPDAPQAKPRASSTQEARFSSKVEPARPERPPREFNGAWKNANPDIVSEVASHLPLPDRLALSESGFALRDAMAQHSTIKAPPSVIKAWSTLRQAPNTGALDALLEHLPVAKAIDKTATAMEFVKNLDHLQAESQPNLKQLDHLYDALSSISHTDPEKAIELVKGLFSYGIARLPRAQHAAGLERTINAIQDVAATIDPMENLGDLAKKRDKQQALSGTLDTAIQKFAAMPLPAGEKQTIGATILKTSKVIYAGVLLHDFAANNVSPNRPLSNEHARSALETMAALDNVPLKLELGYELLTHLHQFKLEDRLGFASQLERQLHALPEQGPDREKTDWLLENIKSLDLTA